MAGTNTCASRNASAQAEVAMKKSFVLIMPIFAVASRQRDASCGLNAQPRPKRNHVRHLGDRGRPAIFQIPGAFGVQPAYPVVPGSFYSLMALFLTGRPKARRKIGPFRLSKNSSQPPSPFSPDGIERNNNATSVIPEKRSLQDPVCLLVRAPGNLGLDPCAEVFGPHSQDVNP